MGGEWDIVESELELTLRGADPLARAFHFSHDVWNRLWEVLANQVAGQAWPGSEETSVDGFAECRDCRVTGSSVEEGG